MSRPTTAPAIEAAVPPRRSILDWWHVLTGVVGALVVALGAVWFGSQQVEQVRGAVKELQGDVGLSRKAEADEVAERKAAVAAEVVERRAVAVRVDALERAQIETAASLRSLAKAQDETATQLRDAARAVVEVRETVIEVRAIMRAQPRPR
jgi:hypothetical protein